MTLDTNFIALSSGLIGINPEWFKLFDSFGRWLGYVVNIEAAILTFHELKRNNGFDSFVTYFRNNTSMEIRLECCAGRLLRPLLVVSNLMKVDSILRLHSHCPVGDVHMALLCEGCIEYVSPAQESTLVVSRKFADVLTTSATHLEISDVSFVGVNAAMAPLFRHNQGPRLAYWIGMAKQAIHCTTQQDQGAATVHNLWYGQMPVVDTTMSRVIGFDQEASGVNCNVIFFPLNYNQEDAIIMNQASVDRGMFVSDMTRSVEASRSISNNKKYNEQFEKPNSRTTIGIKTTNHSHLMSNGLPLVGTKLGPMDTVIGKTVPSRVYSPMAVMYQTSKFSHTDQSKSRRDVSIQMNQGETGVVHSAVLVQNNSSEIAKVRVRATKIPEVGDKFSSRHSQKVCVCVLDSHLLFVLLAYDFFFFFFWFCCV
jgi:DNA-directed RNA polymerase beta subunit